MEVLPPVCSDPAGARQAGDEEPLRSQDDSWIRRVYAPSPYAGSDLN